MRHVIAKHWNGTGSKSPLKQVNTKTGVDKESGMGRKIGGPKKLEGAGEPGMIKRAGNPTLKKSPNGRMKNSSGNDIIIG